MYIRWFNSSFCTEVCEPVDLLNAVVIDEKLHEIAKKRIIDCLEKNNFKVVGIIDSPILGSSGNKEFLCYATKL